VPNFGKGLDESCLKLCPLHGMAESEQPKCLLMKNVVA